MREFKALALTSGDKTNESSGVLQRVSKVEQKGQIVFIEEDRVEAIVNECIQSIAKNILKRRNRVHTYTGQLATQVVNHLIRPWSYRSLLIDWKSEVK
jgi:hypothetical protein